MKLKFSFLFYACLGLVLSSFTFPLDVKADTLASSDSNYPSINYEAMDKARAKQVKHGEYLVKVGDCFTCHTDEENQGESFAGGLKIDTDFGSIYAPNITPDKITGIGKWTDDEFVQAVREGVAPDGSYYYPVFPYNYFNKMTRQDVLDIKSYLDEIPSVQKENHAQEMHWPFNYRILQLGWRILYFNFNKGVYEHQPEQSKEWNRGKFIVEGPGHCALCHTQLNYFGVPKKEYYLSGAFVEGYYAPNISAQGLKHLNNQEVVNIFLYNEMPSHAELDGPMRGVEHNSLRYLKQNDLKGIATYLKTVESRTPPISMEAKAKYSLEDGKRLYESSCEMCHANEMMGAPSLDKRVWKVLMDQGLDRLYEVAIRGSGNMPAKGGCETCESGRVKAAVDYMINEARKNEASTE